MAGPVAEFYPRIPGATKPACDIAAVGQGGLRCLDCRRNPWPTIELP